MPDRPSWTERIPEALDALASLEEQCLTRQQIEKLLGVQKRRAQELMSVVGTTPSGKAVVCDRGDFIEYLKVTGGEELTKVERLRRRQLAQRFAGMRAEHIQKYEDLPLGEKAVFEPEDTAAREMARKAGRRGMRALPEGIELGPGFITVRFNTGLECLQKIQALVLAAGKSDADLKEFEERVQIEEKMRA